MNNDDNWAGKGFSVKNEESAKDASKDADKDKKDDARGK